MAATGYIEPINIIPDAYRPRGHVATASADLVDAGLLQCSASETFAGLLMQSAKSLLSQGSDDDYSLDIQIGSFKEEADPQEWSWDPDMYSYQSQGGFGQYLGQSSSPDTNGHLYSFLQESAGSGGGLQPSDPMTYHATAFMCSAPDAGLHAQSYPPEAVSHYANPLPQNPLQLPWDDLTVTSHGTVPVTSQQSKKRKLTCDELDESFSSSASSCDSWTAGHSQCDRISPQSEPPRLGSRVAKRRRTVGTAPVKDACQPVSPKASAPKGKPHNEDGTPESGSEDHDPANKPPVSQLELIARAIMSVPETRMILADIYQYILDQHPYYRTAPLGWRNTVRYNLSTNECFFRGERAPSGRGFYWGIHEVCLEDFHRGDFDRRQARQKAQQGQRRRRELN